MQLKLTHQSNLCIDLSNIINTRQRMHSETNRTYAQHHQSLRDKTGTIAGGFFNPLASNAQRSDWAKEREVLDQILREVIKPKRGFSIGSIFDRVFDFVEKNPQTTLSIEEIAKECIQIKSKEVEQTCVLLQNKIDHWSETEASAQFERELKNYQSIKVDLEHALPSFLQWIESFQAMLLHTEKYSLK